MVPRRRIRFTIGQLMLANLLLAGLFALPPLLRSPDRVYVYSATVILSGLCFLAAVAELILSKRCPTCSRWALRRLSRQTEYYLCTSCRARLKRAWLGPWRDASGPEDADRYARRTDAGTWTGYDPPGKLDGSRSGLLLQGKRTRNPIDEIRRHPRASASGRGSEEAETKVRKFLRARKDDEGVE